MTADEIKQAIKSQRPILHRDRLRNTEIQYHHAQAWRVSLDYQGNYISSLELVSFPPGSSVTIANADECELMQEDE